MKATLTLTDHGAQTVEFKIDMTALDGDKEINRPTPAAILVMAIKAMFENGQLARAGQLALEGASKGESPSDYLKVHFEEL